MKNFLKKWQKNFRYDILKGNVPHIISDNLLLKERNQMKNQLIWQERYNVGVDIIDKEHKKLFGIMNRLFSMNEKESKSQ